MHGIAIYLGSIFNACKHVYLLAGTMLYSYEWEDTVPKKNSDVINQETPDQLWLQFVLNFNLLQVLKYANSNNLHYGLHFLCSFLHLNMTSANQGLNHYADL